MNPVIARRFPLVARPRPACGPLPQRVTGLWERAIHARDSDDIAAATAVFNLSALLASDCGRPDLARAWSHRLARAALSSALNARHSLEPVVNLARLHIRARNGVAAWTMLETLFRAIDTGTDTVIDGIPIPARRLTHTPGAHAATRSWLWTVLLGTGAHALASAGRWDHARRALTRYNGVGHRMLDGRQITVIAHTIDGRHHQAHATVHATHPGRPWENTVTACLALLITTDPTPADTVNADTVNAALTTYRALGPPDNGLAVFHTRLGLTLLDALGLNHPAAEQITTDTIRHAAHDGHAARDILNHPGCLNTISDHQTRALTTLVNDCNLDAGAIPATELAIIGNALDIAEPVITGPSQPASTRRRPVSALTTDTLARTGGTQPPPVTPPMKKKT